MINSSFLLNISEILMKSGITIFGLEVRFYGIIIATAMLIGVLICRRLCQKRDINPDEIYILALFIIPLSILGARIYYCIFSDTAYTFKTFWNIREGGLAIYGGIIGGIMGVFVYCIIRKNFKIIPILFDVMVPALLFAQAMGRWGNFFNQEAYGNLITNEKLQWFPFGVYIEDIEEWHLATFFYESMWNLIGSVILVVIFYKSKLTGTTTASYLIIYGTGRFFIEGLRTDSLYLWNTSIRVSQALSLILVVIGIVILVNNYIRKRRNTELNKS